MILYGIILVCFAIGVVWISGYHKTAYALSTIPVAIYFFGPQLSRALDRACIAATKSWRTVARLPGRLYCPACASALQSPKTTRPLTADECPKCEGNWCDSREFMNWLTPYGTKEDSWQTIPRDELTPPQLCPQCAVSLESGSLDRLQPFFARCRACNGYWIERMTWAWFELNPPKRAKAARPESPAPVSQLAFRKDPAP